MRTFLHINILILFISNALGAETSVIPAIAPAPEDNPTTPEKIELGKLLYFDPRLSVTKKVSCNTCHRVDDDGKGSSGTDGLPVSVGIAGLKGNRNAPTVWNSGLRSAMFWDGREKSLEGQAKGPLINPVEMAMPNHLLVEKTVKEIKGYQAYFNRAFGKPGQPESPITIKEISQAIGAYERTLMTPDSPFDRYQSGDKKVMSAEAVRGWEKFQKHACIACHGAPTFSNSDFYIRFPSHNANEFEYLFKFSQDPGRYNVTHDKKDMNTWRVPSLRNVAITGPYFHNGSVVSLEQAVRIMGRAQIGKTLPDEDVADIVEFLKSLTGKIPVQKPPKLPE